LALRAASTTPLLARCPNVASRLCDEAKPGQILISPRVLMKVENAVKVEPVGEFVLKGIRRPLAAYNVLSALLQRESSGRSFGETIANLFAPTCEHRAASRLLGGPEEASSDQCCGMVDVSPERRLGKNREPV
jgi:hypothetical protein